LEIIRIFFYHTKYKIQNTKYKKKQKKKEKKRICIRKLGKHKHTVAAISRPPTVIEKLLSVAFKSIDISFADQ
jgi:hypothetical protein